MSSAASSDLLINIVSDTSFNLSDNALGREEWYSSTYKVDEKDLQKVMMEF